MLVTFATQPAQAGMSAGAGMSPNSFSNASIRLMTVPSAPGTAATYISAFRV